MVWASTAWAANVWAPSSWYGCASASVTLESDPRYIVKRDSARNFTTTLRRNHLATTARDFETDK